MVASFGDLGKSARDIFDKNFSFGFLNFEFKTKTENDISVTCGGKHDTNLGRVSGFLESKLKAAPGVSVKTKVDSKWILTSEVEVEKKFHEDLSHNLITTMEPDSGAKSLLLKNKFKHKHFNANLDLNFKSKHPLITGSIVLPIPHYPAFRIGAQALVNSENAEISKQVYAVNFKQSDVQVHAALTGHSDVDLSVFQKFKDMKLGFRVGWRQDTRETLFGAALRYRTSPAGKVKVKIDQNCVVGLAYKLKLSSDACLALCTQFDGKNLESGGQKYGIMFKFGS
ncbi:Voltage-dependent anion-selective channel protein 2 [Schistosoma japonicum]|uniref:Voltage-dependent anion-selective channel protein 2 n=1 Tax=Schistosoma japonicum TaxID=6182 RepID=C1LNX4_SCHJA|nr:Voltage-dependent anion-selective channel protein 2 [Schistosoma japonicum]CAX76402.1 Voltage-dependent anion-selective channel protein 2 [Schistosoma japonicum]